VKLNGAIIDYIVKGKGTERRIPELIPVLGSQPAGDVSHKPGGRLPLLSTRPAVRGVARSKYVGWTDGEREPITGVWGRNPQRGPGSEPLVRGAKSPEAENLLASGCAPEAANLPHSPQFANSLNPRHS